MVDKISAHTLQAFFLRLPLTERLFYWLNFRLLLSTDQLAVAGEKQIDNGNIDAFFEQQFKANLIIHQRKIVFFVFNGIGLLLGFLTMSGALSYTGAAPINIWLMFSIFAFIPLLLSVVTGISLLFPVNERTLTSKPILMAIVKRVGLQQAITQYSQLIFSWSVWKLQSFSVSFSLGALISFFLLATFHDYAFGWSSTLIQSSDMMINLMNIIAAPWRWFIALPSDSVIEVSRFYYNQASSATGALSGQWWPTLVASIVCYGLAPRMILIFVLGARFHLRIKKDILQSGEVERFIARIDQQKSYQSLDPASFSSPDASYKVTHVSQINSVMISWQVNYSLAFVRYPLGVGSWEQDESWLTSKESQFDIPVIVLVDVNHTPTGEFADCLELLQKNTNKVCIGVMQPAQETNIEQQSSFLSWQYFARQHSIELLIVTGVDAHE